jgi:TatA/E family protein of Tat protein translocase
MIGGSELLIIGLIILLLFGADKIPTLMRDAGKGIKQIQKAKDEIKKDLKIEENLPLMKDINEIKDTIKK